MKRTILLVLLVAGLFFQGFSYEKKSLVERYTNYQCGPCASLNSAWYNAVSEAMIDTGAIAHIVYNVNWPGPNDPMYLFNASENATRWAYYGVNSVPWIDVNGTTITTSQSSMQNAVSNGNAQFSPFKMILEPERYSNNLINVHVKILRDPSDITAFSSHTMLRVGLTERSVVRPSGGLEAFYYSITRKMLPDAKGTRLTIPAPGDSVEFDLMYIPTEQFMTTVKMDSLRVVAFIQSDSTKEVYQSEMKDMVFANSTRAAFTSDETMGVSPLTVSFTDHSIGHDSSAIVSWKWDFNNDGTIDSEEPDPEFTYNGTGSYAVSLTVSDGTNEHTRTVSNFVTVLDHQSDILVVNGIDYATYGTEMQTFYDGSAAFGNHQVDIWDLFGEQGFDYSTNANVKLVNLYNRTIPANFYKTYKKIIWIGNNYSGDISYWDASKVLDYVRSGGNFLLATRWASAFFDDSLKAYCGIDGIGGDSQISTAFALDGNLQNMDAVGANTFTHFVILSPSSQSIPIFKKNDAATDSIAGFRLNKENEGSFVYIAGRPYRYNTAASFANYDYIIDHWMLSEFPVNSVDDASTSTVTTYELYQNYPNPFNPTTVIRYQIPEAGNVEVKVYDILGKQVASLVNGFQQAGVHTYQFDASRLSSGIYFYTIKANDYVSSKKMILLK